MILWATLCRLRDRVHADVELRKRFTGLPYEHMACKMASTLLLIVIGAVLLVQTLCDPKHTDAFWCPHECVCSESAMIVDCSSRDLADVPAISLYTKRL